MNDLSRTNEILLKELQELRKEHDALKALYEKDITERKQVEDALRNSEEKYSKAFITSPYAVTITRADDGKFIEINDAFTSITGYASEEAITDSSIGLRLWVNIEDRKSVVSDLLEGKEVKEKEFLFRKKNGEIITGLCSAQIIHLNNKPFILSSINDITNRKQVEEKLKVSEEKFRGFFELTADLVCIASIDGYFQQLNETWEKVLGFTRQELMQKSYLDFVHPEDRDKTLRLIQEKLSQGEMAISFENRYLCKDGGVVWLEWTSQPIPEKRLTFAIARNITERKNAEGILQQTQLFLDSIIELSPNSMWISDEHGTLIRLNQACRDNLHLKDDEVIGKYNLFKDNLLVEQGFIPMVKDVFTKGLTARFTIQYDTAAMNNLNLERTKKVFFEVHISPIVNAQGKVTNAIIQHIDITERKMVEQALAESEEKHRVLMNGSPYGVLATDIETRQCFCFPIQPYANYSAIRMKSLSRLA